MPLQVPRPQHTAKAGNYSPLNPKLGATCSSFIPSIWGQLLWVRVPGAVESLCAWIFRSCLCSSAPGDGRENTSSPASLAFTVDVSAGPLERPSHSLDGSPGRFRVVREGLSQWVIFELRSKRWERIFQPKCPVREKGAQQRETERDGKAGGRMSSKEERRVRDECRGLEVFYYAGPCKFQQEVWLLLYLWRKPLEV